MHDDEQAGDPGRGSGGQAGTPATPATPASHVYYFEVGDGVWHGRFELRVTSWRGLLAARVGVRDTLLVVAMRTVQALTGPSRLESTVVARPDAGAHGVADNTVRLSVLGVTVYLLRERYVLHADGLGVTVRAVERFGPFPRLLVRRFDYPAEIGADGLSSTYHMPLLGSAWTARYRVGADHRTLAGELVCAWARATEVARRTGDRPS